MRALKRNMQSMYYSLIESVPTAYDRDEDGYINYMVVDGEYIPTETGNKEPVYATPVAFSANIHGTVGEAEATRFGISQNEYDAYIYAPKGKFPFVEGTLIWYDTEPVYKDQLHTIVDSTSADYVVKRIPVVLDESIYLLKRLDHER